jgi:hypothetical protein
MANMLFDEEKMFLYATPPIDVFDGMIDIEDFLLTSLPAGGRVIDDRRKVKDIFALIMRCAARVGEYKQWEGDINNLYVFGVPDPDSFSTKLGVVWKQRNNGETFICSPFELKHLSEWLLNKEMVI